MLTMPDHNPKTDTALGSALAFHEYITELDGQAESARTERDRLIKQASREGVTAYRIAKALGVAESTIGRILAKA